MAKIVKNISWQNPSIQPENQRDNLYTVLLLTILFVFAIFKIVNPLVLTSVGAGFYFAW